MEVGTLGSCEQHVLLRGAEAERTRGFAKHILHVLIFAAR